MLPDKHERDGTAGPRPATFVSLHARAATGPSRRQGRAREPWRRPGDRQVRGGGASCANLPLHVHPRSTARPCQL